MSDTLFCYCCRTHHPKEQMRRFTTRSGQRWRCLRSIEAARSNPGEREAFGRRQSELNRLAASRMAERVAMLHLNLCQP
jgi:hypothetical protein